MSTIAFLLTIATQSTRSIMIKIYTDQLHYYNFFGLKIIEGFDDCGVLVILFFILSGGPTIQKKIGQNIYDFIRNFDKDFELKAPVSKIFKSNTFVKPYFIRKYMRIQQLVKNIAI